MKLFTDKTTTLTTGTKEQQPSEWTVRLESAPTSNVTFEPLEFEYEYEIDESGNLIVTEKQNL